MARHWASSCDIVENEKIEKYYHKGTFIPKEKPSVIIDLFKS